MARALHRPVFHVAALLPAGLEDRDVVRRLAARGLKALPLSVCYGGAERRSGLLLIS
jgi:hypothetical protein